MGQELVALVYTVLTTPVRVRRSEILRLRAWLRLALSETNRKTEDGVQGSRPGKQGSLTDNKAMEERGWSPVSTHVVHLGGRCYGLFSHGESSVDSVFNRVSPHMAQWY